jgi:hypothetical protein
MNAIHDDLQPFTSEYECTTMEQADVRAKAWAKNFPPGEVIIYEDTSVFSK